MKHKRDLNIKEPCHEDWGGMEDLGQRRFCDVCSKDVHDISSMSHEEAQTLLETHSDICVRYVFDEHDQVLFRDEKNPTWRLYRQKEGVRKMLAAAALFTPLLFLGCDAPQQNASQATAETIEPVKPIVIDENHAPVVAPGASRKPVFSPPKATPEPELEILMGKEAPIEKDEPACDEDEDKKSDKPHIKAIKTKPIKKAKKKRPKMQPIMGFL